MTKKQSRKLASRIRSVKKSLKTSENRFFKLIKLEKEKERIGDQMILSAIQKAAVQKAIMRYWRNKEC